MILAVDVHYKENYAKSVLVLFDRWESSVPVEIIEVNINEVSEYIPGEFYKRELPCIVDALKKVNLTAVEFIIVDGYVYVDNDFKYGLGGYLYEVLDKKNPIIGVAKTKFQSNQETVIEVFRGESKNPLFVSAIGIDKEEAAKKVEGMYGEFRLPYLLKLMDQKTKEA
jgi:deoxyribonuclease V